MNTVFLVLFALGLYTIIGWAARTPMAAWCEIAFDSRPVQQAATNLLVVFWPLGLPLIIVMGIAGVLLILFDKVWAGLKAVANSVVIMKMHFKGQL